MGIPVYSTIMGRWYVVRSVKWGRCDGCNFLSKNPSEHVITALNNHYNFKEDPESYIIIYFVIDSQFIPIYASEDIDFVKGMCDYFDDLDKIYESKIHEELHRVKNENKKLKEKLREYD